MKPGDLVQAHPGTEAFSLGFDQQYVLDDSDPMIFLGEEHHMTQAPIGIWVKLLTARGILYVERTMLVGWP